MKASPSPRQSDSARVAVLLDALALQLRRTLKTPDWEKVHDLRVATRRFTQALMILGPLLPGGAKSIRRKLKSSLGNSGEVRDFDIALKILRESEVESAVAIIEKIERKRSKSVARLTRMIEKLVRQGAISRWRSKLRFSRGATTDPAAKARPAVKHVVLRAAEHFFDLGDKAYQRNSTSRNSSSHLHRLRIATKKLRYTLDLAVPPDGTPDRRYGQIKELQSNLGHIHDFDSLDEMIAGDRGAKDVLRPLARKQRARIVKFRRDWKREFAGKKNQARWMRWIAKSTKALLAGTAP